MNITYIIGTVLAIVVMLLGIILDLTPQAEQLVNLERLGNFVDTSSIFIVIGCTLAIIVASFPARMLAAMPKHFAIMLNTKKHNPMSYVEQLVELAKVARQNGLLALEELANQQKDPFFKQAIMLIVDANDADKVRIILENDIEQMSARHDGVAGMYEKASAISPAFGMLGTLVGLINMLKGMDMESGSTNIGQDMGVALITTLYGVVLANVIFAPIASNLRIRDEEEVLCKHIIVEGIMSIQSGENPKFLKEKLLTYMAQKQREGGGEGGKGKGKGKKEKPAKEK